MSSSDLKAFVQRYFDALSGQEKSESVLNAFIGDEDAALKRHVAGTESAFPQYQLIVEDMITEGDQIAVRAMFRGVHKGPLGDIPATGQEVMQSFIIIYRIRDGKIVEHWSSIDRLTMLEQLNVVPTSAAV